MKQCSIAIFKLYLLCFTNILFCLDSLQASTSKRVKIISARPWIIPFVLVRLSNRPKACRRSPVRFLTVLALILLEGLFLFSLTSAYVVCFLEFKESKLIPPKEYSSIVLFAAISMKQCNIAIFKLYLLCFTNILFCLDSLQVSTSKRVKIISARPWIIPSVFVRLSNLIVDRGLLLKKPSQSRPEVNFLLRTSSLVFPRLLS